MNETQGFGDLNSGIFSQVADAFKPKQDESDKPLLAKGSSGPEVNELQNLLNDNGEQVSVDGNFGPNTERAIESFQFRKRLQITGTTTPDTWQALSGHGAITFPSPGSVQGIADTLTSLFSKKPQEVATAPSAETAAHGAFPSTNWMLYAGVGLGVLAAATGTVLMLTWD